MLPSTAHRRPIALRHNGTSTGALVGREAGELRARNMRIGQTVGMGRNRCATVNGRKTLRGVLLP